MSTTAKIVWFFLACGFFVLVTDPQYSKPLGNNNWKQLGYSSYTDCKNSHPVAQKSRAHASEVCN